MARKFLLDKNWAGRAFLVPPSSLTDATDKLRRYHTSSSRKFIDTTMGGHFAMNPLSQFTRNCDLPHPSIYAASQGYGRWNSEVLDDNSQQIHIRCGVPQFNSMTNFFGNFYNIEAGSVVRTGRGPSVWFRVGQVAGFLGTIPLQPFILAGTVIKFFMNMPRSKYYYLKPTMYPYWYAVSSICNGLFVNMGMAPHTLSEEQIRFFDPQATPDKVDEEAMQRIYGDVLLGPNGIDVFAISTRAQRLADAYRKTIENALDGLSGDPDKRAAEFQRILQDGVDAGISKLRDPGASLADYEKAYLAFYGQYDEKNAYSAEKDSVLPEWIQKIIPAFQAEKHMGADFVTFRVNHTGSQSESFHNQSTESSLSSEINAMSSKNRMARFNIADGNIAGPIGFAVNLVKDLAAGVLEAAQVEGLVALSGNAFADIQKLYQSSSADLNRTSFTIPLRSWAADDWVRMKNLFLPLAAILAMGLPRATGNATYDGPFLLEVFNQGRTLIREGMIESISIERGVGDVGWAKGGKCLGIDVNVTIVDLSSILSIPINPGFGNLAGVATGAAALAGGAAGAVTPGATTSGGADLGRDAALALNKNTYSEDNKYTDYLATLGGLPLEFLINGTRKWLLNMARGRAQFAQWKSPYRVASGVMSTMPGELLKAISLPTSRD